MCTNTKQNFDEILMRILLSTVLVQRIILSSVTTDYYVFANMTMAMTGDHSDEHGRLGNMYTALLYSAKQFTSCVLC